ncbi:MAG: hypothetical protein ABIV50_14290, partial [Opitutus sp.]
TESTSNIAGQIKMITAANLRHSESVDVVLDHLRSIATDQNEKTKSPADRMGIVASAAAGNASAPTPGSPFPEGADHPANGSNGKGRTATKRAK